MADTGPRLRFDFEGFTYEVYGTQVAHRDFDTLHLAWREPVNRGARSQVVLKLMNVPGDYEQSERAWEEVQLATHLRYAGIATVYGLAVHGDSTYVVTEHMRGMYLLTTMDFALLAGFGLSPRFAAYVAAEVADALAHAHAQCDNTDKSLNIVHRAVSPMRIRLGFDGRVKLTNFGAAYSELRYRLATPPGLLRGDPAYCAPEILRAVMEATGRRGDPLIGGVIDGAADVFSLGLVLLEMLLAEYPLDPSDVPVQPAPKGFASRLRTERSTGLSLDTLAYRMLRFRPEDAASRLEAAPEALRSIVLRALQPDPAARYTAAAMRDELRAYLREQPYGPGEMGVELRLIRDAAAKLRRLIANPIERTALSPDEQGD